MELKFDNGDEAVINIASIQNALSLKNAISKALLAQGVKLANIDLNNVDSLLDAILATDSDESVNKAIFNCLAKSTYNKEKITLDIFEDENARENYYEIIINCLKINLTPFLKPLISKLKDLVAKKQGSQK